MSVHGELQGDGTGIDTTIPRNYEIANPMITQEYHFFADYLQSHDPS
jgi:hypothetical protein